MVRRGGLEAWFTGNFQAALRCYGPNCDGLTVVSQEV